MNVVYLNNKRKPIRTKFGTIMSVTGYIAVAVLSLLAFPVTAVVCSVNQYRCDHIWMPHGTKNSCVRCNKKQRRKELLGLERL